MIYRKLGRTNYEASEIGLGCEHLQGMDYAGVKEVIDAAIEEKINIMDIFMSEPEVRSNIGRALKGRREKMMIQGHLGSVWEDGQYARSRDLDKVKIFCKDILDRLETDYIDIGMIHYVDEQDDLDRVFNNKIMEYAKELKKNGVIKMIGLSSHSPKVAKTAVLTGDIDVLMFSINPAYDLLPEVNIDALFDAGTFKSPQLNGIHPDRSSLYEACEGMGTAITVMKTLGAGTLLSAGHSPFGVALSAEQCIHYALTRPAVSSVLIGCRTADEVKAAVKYESTCDDERDYSVILSSTPKYSARGRCMYCNHCLPCPSGINIAQVNKFLDLASVQEEVPPSVAEHYRAMNATARDCIACGSCESNCPFGVEIIKRMEKAEEIFGK